MRLLLRFIFLSTDIYLYKRAGGVCVFKRQKMRIKKGKTRNWITKGPLPFKYVLLITLIFFIFLTMFSLIIINRNLEPTIMDIAETRARQFAAQAINDAIDKNISENVDIKELIVKHEYNGETAFSFNPQIYHKVTADASKRVQKYLDLVEAGEIDQLENFKNDINIKKETTKSSNGIVYHIPLGMATGMTLLSNLGPDIPVRLQILGDVTSNVETKIIPSGINNTYLEAYINVKVHMNVIIPLKEEPIEVSYQVKVGDLFLEGKVPQYYNPGIIPPPTN